MESPLLRLDLAGRRLLGGVLMRASRVTELRLLCLLARHEINTRGDYRATVGGGGKAAQAAAIKSVAPDRQPLAGHTSRALAELVTHAPKPDMGGDCMFWARGGCEKSVNCPFRHDPHASKRQRDRASTDVEQK